MAGIKQLASQTLWYGLPTIASRFLGYLMNMALPFFVEQPGDTADLVQVYALIPFLNILFSYGLETAYFRFSQTHPAKDLYNTLSISLFISTCIFSITLILLHGPLTNATDLENHPGFLYWMIAILAVDNLNTIPFARLRQENRPKRYAFARLSGILLNVLIVITFLGIIPSIIKNNPSYFVSNIYDPGFGLGYYLAGNLAGSLVTMLILSPQFRDIRFRFQPKLWKEVIRYSAPLIIVGLGGMVNDVMSRLLYRHVVDLPREQADHELGIFANIFRIALVITIMIQAFRMAAEPFFFNQSRNQDAKKTYARVMKFFVIACCFMFLLVGLFVDVFKWFFATFADPAWAEGMHVVPVLALGNIFLGIYYNLSIWYKLTNKNNLGALITIVGAVVTIVLNILLIPILHYAGAALATFLCYLVMMVMSYKLGQRYYPVPYAVKKLLAYISIAVVMCVIQYGVSRLSGGNLFITVPAGLILFAGFGYLVFKVEAKELRTIPVIKKLYR